MAHAIALKNALAHDRDLRVAELARALVVTGCGLALIAAGQALPFAL